MATIEPGGESAVHEVLPDLSAFARSIGFRVPSAGRACVTGLHPFQELRGHRTMLRPPRVICCSMCGPSTGRLLRMGEPAARPARPCGEGRGRGPGVPLLRLSDDDKPADSHVALNTITGPDGTEQDILRTNMPFGSFEQGEFGTYFIGYAADPEVTEQMLRNMFLGNPPTWSPVPVPRRPSSSGGCRSR